MKDALFCMLLITGYEDHQEQKEIEQKMQKTDQVQRTGPLLIVVTPSFAEVTSHSTSQ